MDSQFSARELDYRGRLAPSPTGYLHVGHARTFWTAFERARAAGGTLVMRMEDLDLERSREVYAMAALEDLRWLGIEWQEGPDLDGLDLDGSKLGGRFAPYRQSQRHSVYETAMQRLLEGGFVYPCRCSRKDLAAALSAPHESGAARNPQDEDLLDDEPVYAGTCRPAGPFVCESGAGPGGMLASCNWRFRVPDGEVIEFEDGNLGAQRFTAGVDFGDFVVWRRDVKAEGLRTGLRPWSDGVPSYQLACVADDAAMKITEVVRGEDLLKSTARQILLNRALGFENPSWFHCRLTVDANGRRLAKRHDALSLRVLRAQGATPAEILSAEHRRDFTSD